MTLPERPTEEQHIACEICLKEVPISEAECAEAEDYVVHFCGLDCYATWRKQKGTAEPEAKGPAAPGK